MNLPRFLISAFLIFAQSTYAQLKAYDLEKPFKVLELPDTLREVSGITLMDYNRLACVQDENGIIFIYNFQKGVLEKHYTFAPDGDYEGIARVGDTLYVLRSDGFLFESIQARPAVAIATGIPASNNEGLCYDRAHHRLLVASKVKPGKGPEQKDNRLIYAFDLCSRRMAPQPAFEFRVSLLKQFVKERNIALPDKEKKNGSRQEVFRFTPSAIAVHPISQKLYLISSTDHLLFVFDAAGNVEEVVKLDPVGFNKPEGISFLDNGDLFITNEGQHKKPSLLWFKSGN